MTFQIWGIACRLSKTTCKNYLIPVNYDKSLNAGRIEQNTPCFKITAATFFIKLVVKTDLNLKTSIGKLRNIYGNSKNRARRLSWQVKRSKYVVGLVIENLREKGFDR
ncbi:hypothetical protein CDIK_3837 [Cucumispora dikerogammari]|nr:hypothetical protein CDIK_3837 [Cucumispora dikerogammari]